MEWDSLRSCHASNSSCVILRGAPSQRWPPKCYPSCSACWCRSYRSPWSHARGSPPTRSTWTATRRPKPTIGSPSKQQPPWRSTSRSTRSASPSRERRWMRSIWTRSPEFRPGVTSAAPRRFTFATRRRSSTITAAASIGMPGVSLTDGGATGSGLVIQLSATGRRILGAADDSTWRVGYVGKGLASWSKKKSKGKHWNNLMSRHRPALPWVIIGLVGIAGNGLATGWIKSFEIRSELFYPWVMVIVV